MLTRARRRIASLGLLVVLCLAASSVLAGGTLAAPPVDETPQGANDWTCTPGAQHPRPVVLVHGTWADMAKTWNTMAPALKEEGYCVFALNYGSKKPGSGQNLLDMVGGDTIEDSASTLARFVDRVRNSTGAGQVDLIGHSQGALVAREFLKSGGGSDPAAPSNNTVHTLVSLAGTNQGTSFNLNQQLGAIAEMLGIPVIGLAATTVGPSYVEQMTGSPFLKQLNAGPDTLPGIKYVAVGTKDDVMVTPPEHSFLEPAQGSDIQNIWVQDGCESAHVDHMEVTSHPRALWLTKKALDPAYEESSPGPCT